MIKFWKSAAKGRSGYPVRPPEEAGTSRQSSVEHEGSSINKMRYNLATISDDDPPLVIKKESRLSISLEKILQDENFLKYFIQYMESIQSVCFIQFWLDIEQFKAKVKTIKGGTEMNYFTRRIRRTSSLDGAGDTFAEKEPIKRRHSTFESNHTPSFNNNNNCRRTSYLDKINETNESSCSSDQCDENKNDLLTCDAIALFKKYIALEAEHKLELPESIRNIIISNICQPDGNVDEGCFDTAQEIVYNQLKTNFFQTFLKSPLYTRAQLDILTSGSLTLEDVLFNETVLFFFMEYLEQESSRTLLEFIMAVMNFSDNYPKSDPKLAQEDAVALYEKYFSLQASDPIGFPDDVRLEIELNICEEGGPAADCFHKPFRIVFKTLSKLVKSFLESEVYYKYLNEMINSNKRSHKRAVSECSSEISINTHNTLLAMGDTHFRSKSRNSLPDMNIDANQLYNADALWQRKRQDGLSLGRVNSLGQFESKFEPDPDRKNKSVLKKMIDKIVPNSNSEIEEEMAWQVAQMIVKDITDMTMSPASDNC